MEFSQGADGFRPAEFQLIRRKRPLSPRCESAASASTAFAGLARPASSSMLLPALSDLLASQKRGEPRLSPLRQRTTEQGEYVSPPLRSEPAPVAVEETDDDDDEDKTPWPSAAQYHEIFANKDSASEIPLYDLGVDPRGVPLHPEFIYSQPVSCMYFLKCARLLGKGSFGFPRKVKKLAEAPEGGKKAAKGKKEPSKEFEWRKMSFVTGLPKKQPIVRYITATCYSRATDVAAKKKVFRMHAVMLADEAGNGEMGDYVLVHIRAGGSKRVGLRASLAAEPEQQQQQQLPQSPQYEAEEQVVPVRRPVSPPMAAVSSYNSQAASTSPRNKKRRHTEFAPSANISMAGHFASPLPMPPKQAPAAPSVRHSLFTPSASDAKVNSARLAMRELILNSCSSRDEVAKYVLGLQEELAALQRQSS